MGLRRFSAGGNGGKRVRAIAKGGPSAEVLVGLKDHWPMKLIVVFDPPDFTRQLENWPPDVD